MKKMTSAYANKVLKKLKEDKVFWVKKEQEGYMYVAALDEEPVIPEYDYKTVADKIAEIDEKIAIIKHTINLVNVTNEIAVGDKMYTIDTILVKMAQMNKRKEVLDRMRKMQPQTRIRTDVYISRKTSPEYQYINFDLELVKKEYEELDARIATMQIELDKFNQTFEFEVNI